MLHRLLDIFHSFLQIAFRIIFARKAQVLFYYPQHFNRSAAGTNPFFDPLLQTCEEAGISYKLLEEPDWGTDKPRNPRAIKADAFFVLVLILRKLVKLAGIKDFYAAEPHVARLVNVLTFGRLRYRRYVTISGSMQFLFAAMNEDTRVYDMQHGNLYKQHYVFFGNNRKLRKPYYNRKLKWLVWGKGYRDCFCQGEEELLADRVFVVGYPIHSEKNIFKSRDNVLLLSLQLTADYNQQELIEEKKLLEGLLEQLQGSNYKVLLKHHPRYNDIISVDDWSEKYDNIEFSMSPLDELVAEVKFHITCWSTTAFEYAKYGIPTYFLYNDIRPMGKRLFYEEYKYPLYYKMHINDVLERISDDSKYAQDASCVQEWYQTFYSTYDSEVFKRLLID